MFLILTASGQICAPALAKMLGGNSVEANWRVETADIHVTNRERASMRRGACGTF